MDLRQRLESGTCLPRHKHVLPYAAVVLRGSYHEAGDSGRRQVEPGDVLIHESFVSHFDCVSRRHTVVLNLPLAEMATDVVCHGRVDDPEFFARLAERDPCEAAGLLLEQLRPGRPAADEPVDRLAYLLAAPDAPSIVDWSSQIGARRETVFRWFRAAYGVGPARYRAESRARLAWRMIVTSRLPLADVAASLGFADQAHMSRSVRALTGFPPQEWRRCASLQHPFKTPRS